MAKKPYYEPELKQRIIRLHLEEGRTQKSLTEEYGLGPRYDIILVKATPQRMPIQPSVTRTNRCF